MIFPTMQFAAFFVVVMFASWLLMPNPTAWKPFIVCVSLFFYGYADWRWVGLIVLSIVFNQCSATLISNTTADGVKRRKRLLVSAIVGNLTLLAAFKYLGFFVDSVNSVLNALNFGLPLPLLQIALPIGISFFTFQAISYVVDVYRGDATLASPIDYAVYASFFPHLIAGPIVRAREFIPQLAKPRDPRAVPVVSALFLIVGGLIKKLIFADMLATRLVDPVFAAPEAHSALDALAAIVGYSVQIYCDFSGYADIAIGVAMLLGFRFPQNFNRPYAALSLQEFWRRWHMTLSRWLRDYVYFPLGGNHKGARRTRLNLMITMLLGGLWHGAAWTFVVWGALHGGGLACEKWASQRRRDPDPVATERDKHPEITVPEILDPAPLSVTTSSRGSISGGRLSGFAVPSSISGVSGTVLTKVTSTGSRARQIVVPKTTELLDAVVLRNWPRWALWLATFGFVSFAWVLFRADSVGEAIVVIGRLVTGWTEPSMLVTPTVLSLIAVALGTQFLPQRVWRLAEMRFARLPLIAQGAALGAILVLINAMVGQQGVAPFIYFSF